MDMFHRRRLSFLIPMMIIAGTQLELAEIIDRIVAVVNHQIITLSDVEQERKFLEIGIAEADDFRDQPEKKKEIRLELTEKLIEQNLILQQMQEFPGLDVSPEEIESQIVSIRRKLGSAEEWEQLLNRLHITLEDVRMRVKWQLQAMKFFDYRFRQFVVVDQKEIEGYYRNEFLTELRRKGITEQPPLPEVEEKIQAILIEEKLNAQIEDWLKSLRDSAAIEIFN
ncbi:MAG: hypothetical protein DMG06_12100 [Acidobacteria bacterium]|nr:MAG: hypothetical protein DMG06_12100 [Acidobacteriota bacterium]